jgi:hypothetical protein
MKAALPIHPRIRRHRCTCSPLDSQAHTLRRICWRHRRHGTSAGACSLRKQASFRSRPRSCHIRPPRPHSSSADMARRRRHSASRRHRSFGFRCSVRNRVARRTGLKSCRSLCPDPRMTVGCTRLCRKRSAHRPHHSFHLARSYRIRSNHHSRHRRDHNSHRRRRRSLEYRHRSECRRPLGRQLVCHLLGRRQLARHRGVLRQLERPHRQHEPDSNCHRRWSAKKAAKSRGLCAQGPPCGGHT